MTNIEENDLKQAKEDIETEEDSMGPLGYSITQEDRPRGNRSGLYEFFRGKAWVCGHALVGMAKVL